MLKKCFAPLLVLATLASPSWAIYVEPDQPDLQNPKTQLVESGRAAETSLNGGTTSISASGFTGFNDAVKRKAFPPGYGRSGYQFEDELTGPDTTQSRPVAREKDAPVQGVEPPSSRNP